MKVILSDKARGDLLRIDKHLADRNEAAADALAAKFNTSFSNLARFPFLGRPRIGLGAGVRCLVVGRHLVFYVVDQDGTHHHPGDRRSHGCRGGVQAMIVDPA